MSSPRTTGLPTSCSGRSTRRVRRRAASRRRWTLDVEVAFYAFLPLWAWFMRRLPGRTPARRLRSELVALGALALASVAYKAIVL